MDTSGALDLTLGQDRSAGLTVGVAETRIEHDRAVTISMHSENERLRIVVTPHPDYAAFFPVTQAWHPTLTRDELWGKVSDCLSVWHRRVVYLHPMYRMSLPFQEQSEKPLSLIGTSADIGYKKLLKHIARSGMVLFQQIFIPHDNDHADLGRIGASLQELCKIPDLWIRIVSDRFYAPWNLMYLGNLDDLKDPSPSQFWGYQHVIEHDASSLAVPSPTFKPQLDVALHFDEGIDADEKLKGFRCNATILEHLDRYASMAIRQQHFKEGFLEELRQGTREQLFYFCCHGLGEEGPGIGRPRLLLTDPRTTEDWEDKNEREAIEPDEIELYLRQQKQLRSHPIVFLNCCHVAKMNSAFYQGFAGKFLNLQASAVIGPHVEIPAVFARDFALRFFQQFFEGGTNRSLGAVMLALRREFFDTHHNPLGLTYALYRGADICIESPVLLKPPSS